MTISHPSGETGHQTRGLIGADAILRSDRIESISSPRPLRATGFEPLDTVLNGGLAPEELVVVGGRPGVGKSVAVVQWARNLARAGRKVLLAAYEHGELVTTSQLLLIEVGENARSPVETVNARRAVDELISGRCSWAEAIGRDPLLGQAAERLDAYSANLVLLDRGGRSAGFDVLSPAATTGEFDVVIVDHLQKVRSASGRTAAVCKDLAVDTATTVIAVSTVTDDGVGVRRLRPVHFEDAAIVSHEADVEIALNPKLDAVSRSHSAYDSVNAEGFRTQVVFTIEKNRRGLAGIDLEFERDFAHRRFQPQGGFVSERLVDEVHVVE